MFKKWGLRQKLAVVFLITTLVPVFGLGWYGYSSAHDLLWQRALDSDHEGVIGIAVDLVHLLDQVPTDLHFLADRQPLRRLLEGGGEAEERRQVEEIFLSFVRGRSHYLKLRLIDAKGNEQVRVDYDPAHGEGHALPSEALQYKGERPYFTETIGLAKGHIYQSPLNLNREHGRISEPYTPVMRFATPVTGEGEQTLGIVVASLDGEAVLDIISNRHRYQHEALPGLHIDGQHEDGHDHGQEPPPISGDHHDPAAETGNGTYLLVEPDGHYVYHPDPAKRWGHDLNHHASLAQDQPELMAAIRHSDHDTLVGRGVISHFMRLKLSDAEDHGDWFLIKQSPEKVLLEELRRFEYAFAVVLGAVLLLSLGIAWWVGGLIMRPLEAVTAVLREVARGNPSDTALPYDSKDEVGELARSARSLNLTMRATIEQAGAIADGDFSVGGGQRTTGGQLGKALARMTRALRQTASIAEAVAEGDFGRRMKVRSENDRLGESLNRMTARLSQLTELARGVADGDFSRTLEAAGERDELSRAVNRMTANFREVVEQANAVARGDYSVSVTPSSDHDELAIALNEMTVTLREVTTRDREQNWLKGGQAELNEHLRGELDARRLAEGTIRFLATYLEAEVGAFYLSDKERLRLIAGYAYPTTEAIEFGPGEGLVGQVAAEGRPILLERAPAGYLTVRSGLGESDAVAVLLVPLLHQGRALGVIELGSLHGFTPTQRAFLELAAEGIAVALAVAEARRRTQELLEETQSQAEELQAQQEELRQANEELEERTESLEQQQKVVQAKNDELEQARRELEAKADELTQASRYKSEFLANMSHELRTPLNSLLILAQLLMENKDGNLTPKQEEFARTIHTAGSDLLELINDILDLSKVEAGRIELHLETVTLAELAHTIEHKFHHVAEDKGLEFRLELDEGLPETIRSDRQRIEQVLKNLLSNAFKFTSQGAVTLALRRAGGRLALAVKDSGIGIPADKLQLIFEAFQQADGSTSRRYGGTGLGLSISREFARLLGGELGVESAEGQGSTFTLYLPLDDAGAPQAPATSRDRGQPAPAPRRPSSPAAPAPKAKAAETTQTESVPDDRRELQPGDKSLLIVEDDSRFAKILLDLARERGFLGLVAEEGETALHLADYYKPSAVLLDIGLPGMDGWAVMQRLKENPETRHIPVHFISGKDQELDARKMGAVGYLLKPTGMADLGRAFAKLERFIGRQGRRVLLLEGDEERGSEIERLIAHEGVELVRAEDCAEARQELGAEPFDCLILDLGSGPELGLGLLEWMEADEAMRRIPVIAYAGRDLTLEEDAALNRHGGNMIIKGVESPERLLDEVALFLHEVEERLPEEHQRMIRATHDKSKVLEGNRILLVDDDMRNVYALAATLEENGMEVEVAANGRQALEQLDEVPDIDLVLMDIMMPEMDGYEAMRRIRAQERFAKLPIIALTAKAMKGDKAKCIEAGANDYLAKPVEIAKLLSMMRVWLYR